MVYEEEDSDVSGDNESHVDEDEHVNLDDVSDNDSDASTDDLPCSSSQVKPKKRKVPSSSEEPCSDSKKTKKKKLSRSNDGEITDAKSGTVEQESVDESVWGMSYIIFANLVRNFERKQYNVCDATLHECISTPGKLERYAWPRWESNLRPLEYWPNALPTELRDQLSYAVRALG